MGIGLPRRKVNDVDGSSKGRGPVINRRRPAQYLDALDVVEADDLERGRKRASGGDPIDEEQKVVHFPQPEQAGHSAGRAGIPA